MSRTARILISLDVLLDTRIATVARMDQEKAVEILNGNYHQRKSDFFDGIDKAQFDLMYDQRDLETLLISQCTNIVLILKNFVSSIIDTAINTPYIDDCNITINTYPYDIDDKTITTIKQAVMHWVDRFATVDHVHLSDENLTPSYIKDNYDVLYMYQYDKWLETQTSNFEKTQIPRVDLYVPAISLNHDLTDKMIRDIKEETGQHPFDHLKFGLAPFINIKPIDVSAFSIFNPEKLIAS